MADLSMEFRTGAAMNSPQLEAGNRQDVVTTQREQVISKVEEVKGKQRSTQQEVEPESVSEVIEKMNDSSAIRNTSLQFVFDERGDPPVVKVVDKDSGEMIRQIPSELAVKLAKALEEVADNKGNTSGFLFDKQV
ncbi:flagellar protein FlaG [Idiomarina sp. HP20-50]|uniref:flagellar protein FlaG n=1 Tax=Idiomarina sp. HP20-50 TaxID=3070813 RepID=UPI00294AD462|nr:flagellar protein FlaG [Idiomarina sp. HP20-50]MDV6316974.1 flagellar protein FlaG [Idiomarina sp. HP20-50]